MTKETILQLVNRAKNTPGSHHTELDQLERGLYYTFLRSLAAGRIPSSEIKDLANLVLEISAIERW